MRSMLAKGKLLFSVSGCQSNHTELRAELIGSYNNTNKLSGTILQVNQNISCIYDHLTSTYIE
jgi:hypothetical protein